jgi:hypothetical protein
MGCDKHHSQRSAPRGRACHARTLATLGTTRLNGKVEMMKTRQASKIRELGDALVAAGFVSLDQQAQAIGLCRSTTWTILKANHKTSGLSASVINRMLAAPQLPPLVRRKILEYVEEKTAGLYGHCKTPLRRFSARLSVKPFDHVRTKSVVEHHEAEKRLRIPPDLVASADPMVIVSRF